MYKCISWTEQTTKKNKQANSKGLSMNYLCTWLNTFPPSSLSVLSSWLFLGFGFGGDLACFSSDVVVIVVREELLEEPEICWSRKHNDTTRNSISHSAAKEQWNTKDVISSRLWEFLKILVVTKWKSRFQESENVNEINKRCVSKTLFKRLRRVLEIWTAWITLP